ncbi:unnamed protein product [Dovyalis caffra]|uniref:Uncharacterized protein n=1 Tax=Dovyalis caffra TaxID=77055 RepID=A0AAV1STF7_9ROSI|nr:unnamed protein product [Dovyalis caffra]
MCRLSIGWSILRTADGLLVYLITVESCIRRCLPLLLAQNLEADKSRSLLSRSDLKGFES